MNTPQHSQDELKQKVLEDKLKTHIQREFTLGEKVISLLKQKKELEKSLREQQCAQQKLEEELHTLGQSKQHVERKYHESEKALQERQSRLKTRSRIIIEDEEQSRENLEHLQSTIQELQRQLKTVDAQKIEEKKLLVQKLRKLRHREKLQQQKLGKIVQQRDMVERRLRSVVKKYKQLSSAYHKEKKQHETQLEQVHKEQVNREARIELLRDEKHLNEESLLKEVESLKQAKAELEAKLARVEQKNPGTSWALDADLLQVIEKQNQYIQELKDKAHQRSTFLRGENDSLREEMEALSTSQEKVKWENQMLESSLKDLQADLAEYIQLKHKFDEVQKEKEDFEQLFQRRLRFFEDRETGEDNGAGTPEEPIGTHEAASEDPGQELDASQKAALPFFKRVLPTKSRLIDWLNVSKPKLFLAVVALLIIVLTVQLFRLIPWRYIHPLRISETVEPVELPQTPELDALDLEGRRRPPEPQSSKVRRIAELSASAATRRNGPVASVEAPVKESSSQEQPATAAPIAKQAPRISSRKHPFKSLAQPIKTRPTHILVQLTSLYPSNVPLQSQTPFPTIENNSILRRHYEQKRRTY